MVRGRRPTMLLGACLLLGVWLPARATGAGAVAPPPLPDSMAAIGDSITQAFDDCCSFGSHPQDSWSTGDGYPANGIASHYQRILERNESIADQAFNYSVSGARVADTLTQAQSAVHQQVQYVTILIGADDVCTSTIGSMTPTSSFQSAFEATMSTLESGLPAGAHIFVASIPNIFQLWSQLHTNPTAQIVWSVGHICQSMLAPANTPSQRQQVVAQEQADNGVLASVCGLYANCRWDGGATYNYTFSASDVSTLDFFHPSQTGQAKVAALTWNASWWPDNDLSIGQPANITNVNATGPSGTVVTYPAPTVSDPDDTTLPTPTCGPGSGSTFAIGTTTVNCSVSDIDDTNSPQTTSFSVTVVGAAGQLQALQHSVIGVGPGTSFYDKLGQAQTYLAANDNADNCSTLSAFINEVNAQSGKSITKSTATSLVTSATRIRAVMSC